MNRLHLIGAMIVSVFGVTVASADTVSIPASKDNTLFESATGALSNGVGPYLYAGTAASSDQRRAVLAFDVAGNIPAGSTITGAVLNLNLSLVGPQSPGPASMKLHRLTANWGEGTSDAGDPGGMGASSTTNDATWIHRFYNTSLWATAGGDFAGTMSAATTVNSLGLYSWGSTPQMISDVQGWLTTPANNFGWILIGDEVAGFSARRYNSRENSDSKSRPELIVTFTAPAVPAMSTYGMIAVMGLVVCGGAWIIRRSRATTSAA